MSRPPVRAARAADLPQLGGLYLQHLQQQQQLDPLLAAQRNPRFDAEGFLRQRWSAGLDQLLVTDAAGQLVGFVRFHLLRHGAPSAVGRVDARALSTVPRRAICWARGALTQARQRLAPAGVSFHPAPQGNIADLYVEPHWRRGGRARALLRAALAWYRHHGVDLVTVQSLAANEAAQRLWQQQGFQLRAQGFALRLPPEQR